MVGVKQLILSVYLFFQEIDAFCIRNELTDGSSFRASLLYSFARVGKAFTQHMERGTKTCCHYTKKDCSRNQRNDDPTTFRVSFTIHF
ncbi:hypothetical protein EDC94DRAFT_607963 [Helicostylum pulchrum]|nr:hypothetical protein EDC94DRAFT_607963 [Helicostylum pulchrum]